MSFVLPCVCVCVCVWCLYVSGDVVQRFASVYGTIAAVPALPGPTGERPYVRCIRIHACAKYIPTTSKRKWQLITQRWQHTLMTLGLEKQWCNKAATTLGLTKFNLLLHGELQCGTHFQLDQEDLQGKLCLALSAGNWKGATDRFQGLLFTRTN